jgi:formate/nitrite transporter FocA (FNT family)
MKKYLQILISSIGAGILIALGGFVYLSYKDNNAFLASFLFSLGLITIISFKLYLFTGKVGYIFDNKPSFLLDLLVCWIGNLIGCVLFSILLLVSPLGMSLAEGAAAIITVRITNLWFENIILGIFCGILMYIAVKQYPTAPYVTILSVASFILLGANHCVADMAYMFLAANPKILLSAFAALIFTTIGNIIGTNIIPYVQKQSKSSSSSISSSS